MSAFFVLETQCRELFTVKVDDPSKIEHIRNILSGIEKERTLLVGTIVKSQADYNPDWSFHLDPASLQLVKGVEKASDATICGVEDQLHRVGRDFLPDNRMCDSSLRFLAELEPDKAKARGFRSDILRDIMAGTLDFSRDSGKVDPNGLTRVGHILPGNNMELGMHGKWIPGRGHPSWGPKGDSNTKYNGANKWCALVYYRYWEGKLIWSGPYYRRPASFAGYGNFGTEIYVVMNDDIFGDNTLDKNDPMEAYLYSIG